MWLWTVAVILCVSATQVAAAQTVDQIIEQHLKARGGLHRIRALETQSFDGMLSFGNALGERFHTEMKRTGKVRQEVQVQGKRLIQISDGKQGWQLTADGSKPPEALSAAQLKNLMNGADLDGPFVDYKAKGTKIELAGTVKIVGRNAYKLVLIFKDGERRVDYIDTKTGLDLKWEGEVGGEKMESFFTDYRKVNGLAYAFRIVSRGPGFEQLLQFDSIRVNVDLPDSHFQKP